MYDESQEVWEPAGPDLVRIFEQIPAAVGVPGVHQLWRRLANYPAFLTSAWPGVAASLRSTDLEDCAARLRAGAFIVEAVGMPSHKAFRGDLVRAEIGADLREKIEHFNDLSQASLSRLVVVAVAARHPRGGEQGAASQRGDTVNSQAGSRGLSVDAVYVPPLRDGEAVGKTRELLERVEREHVLPFLDDYYRSLARIPDFLSAAWNAIRPVVGDPFYLDRAAELLRMAGETASELPAGAAAATALEAMDAGQAQLVRETLDLYAQQVLPQTLIDVTLIKALTSGPQHATTLAP